MTGAQAVQISESDEPTPVFIPGGGGLGPLTQRVTDLETVDDTQNGRLSALELASGDPAAVQTQIDESISAHVNAVAPHPVYDDLPSLTLLFENGLI
jgi:hypothetical protein